MVGYICFCVKARVSVGGHFQNDLFHPHYKFYLVCHHIEFLEIIMKFSNSLLITSKIFPLSDYFLNTMLVIKYC